MSRTPRSEKANRSALSPSDPRAPQPACAAALRSLGADGGSESVAGARRHIDACPVCSALVDDAGSADAVLAALARQRPSRSLLLRWVLGLVAGLQCLIALPWLFGENPFGFLESSGVAPAHLTRDGAIGIIIGVAGCTTALRPRHAVAMLVTATAAVGMQVLSFAIDENHERVHPLFETSHVLIPIVVVLVGLFALRRARPVPPRDHGRERHLRAI